MTLSPEGATPAMAQWFECKASQPDALLFFRMGDFYELFFSDAEAAVAALDIQLTYRGEHGGRPIPMCGVPAHAAELYLARLIRRGFRVAVVEQMEKPKPGSKLPIRREIVRLVTPGTLVEDTLLEPRRCNLLVALVERGGQVGAAWMDLSSGIFETECVLQAEVSALLGRLDPAEILTRSDLALADFAGRRSPLESVPSVDHARQVLRQAYGTAGPDAFGCFSDLELQAASLALDYARMTQAGRLPRLSHPCPRGDTATLILDAATRASLDIVRARDGSGKHTLLSAVDHTLTAAGGRLLADWLQAPLCDVTAISGRQQIWQSLLDHPALLSGLQTRLRGAPDMARALARLGLGKCLPRDLAAIRDGLQLAHDIADALGGAPVALADLRAGLPAAPALCETLHLALHPEPRCERSADQPIIAAGYDGELDAHRSLRDDSKRVIAGLQLDYAQRYGVASLKIRHHQQMGYVIEVPNAAAEILRGHPELQLRQGLANGARFLHPQLSDLDRQIRDAADQATLREQLVIGTLVQQILDQADRIMVAANALAGLDVAQSASRLAVGGRWCRPDMTQDAAFDIVAGRHPVVEQAIAGQGQFVANPCDLSPDRRVMLLTGPNMAGKSTFLRQNALIVILAQAGLPVPAEKARIGIVDRLFSRVGASDDLARGQSTFMVEMIEAAAILRSAGPKSLVVVDEIGRGTATLDGLALAWAVLEALHFQNRCRTIFATHFHELADLGTEMGCLSPHTMKVMDARQTGVVFLHEVAAGKAGRSWGVHVAQLAGVPAPVVRRAGQILAALERNGPLTQDAALPLFAAANRLDHMEAPLQDRGETAAWDPPEIAQTQENRLLNALAAIDPDQLSPKDALNTLYQLKKMTAHDPMPVQ